MGPCRLLKTIFAQFLGKYRVVSALFGKIERLTFTGTFDAFQHLVKSHSFKQICFPHRSEMGVLKSFLYYRKSPQSIGIVMRRISSEFTEASNSAYHRPTPQLQIPYQKSVISKLKHPSAPTAPFPMQSQEQRLPFAHFRMHLYHAVRSYHTVPFKALKRRKTWTDADFFSSQGLFSPRDRHQAPSLRRRRR